LTLQADATALSQILPDGSAVTLNKHSSLRYPAAFKGGGRPVTRVGGGLFNTRTTPSQPFLVDVGAAPVRVLGTSSNVRNRDSATVVIVETGRVAVRAGGQQQEIVAGEEARITAGGTAVERTAKTDACYQDARTRVF